ncbi:hypothetical protein OUZ56_022483 [Daphnia magna]|uniref:Uncharacterized protein n=1 Tax=Daphnia magna TaxID=35525 RepID=A0ABR0AWJ1_9CRUS|nr:hypothetical protein OUZ56_022483 [Daphnia magna]
MLNNPHRKHSNPSCSLTVAVRNQSKLSQIVFGSSTCHFCLDFAKSPPKAAFTRVRSLMVELRLK